MFKYLSLREQMIDQRKKNAGLKSQTDRNAADIDYIAMMSDIELDTAQEPEMESADETTETEVDEDDQQI